MRYAHYKLSRKLCPNYAQIMPKNLIVRDRCFIWGQRTYLMGILNVTPDSFSDGGDFETVLSALSQAQAMVDAGADIIDIGGQSTRPGAELIPLEVEISRVVPVIQAIRGEIHLPISIDTTRASVAQAAIAHGVDLVNDISGGTFDPEMLPLMGKLNLPIILMHSRGTPQTMQQQTDYQDLMSDIGDFLSQQATAAIDAGISPEKIIIDPGIGFAKNFAQNLEILRRLELLKLLNLPILVGVSRKSFIGHILNQPDPKTRVMGTAAACCAAISHGADILRIHDVREIRDISLVADQIYRYPQT